MKLKQIKISGFRGFNVERKIEFHEHLTLISASNSQGKTSITEALEFLIYGETSKVAQALSKEEFKDSYRNRHFSIDRSSVIEASFADEGQTVVFRAELEPDGTVSRYVDDVQVETWPLTEQMYSAARPFVVQHALKDLLLATPAERFQGFARLLGLYDIDAIQQAILNLSTKPEANISDRAKLDLRELQALEGRLEAHSALKPALKDMRRGSSGLEAAYKKLVILAEKLLKKNVKPNVLLASLVTARDAAAAKVYAGTVAVSDLSIADQSRLIGYRDRIAATVQGQFLDIYGRLASQDAVDRLQKEMTLLSIGLELIADLPDRCPLCEQSLNDPLRAHMAERHVAITARTGQGQPAGDPRTQITSVLDDLHRTVKSHRQILNSRSKDLQTAVMPDNQERMESLFGKDNEASWEIVRLEASNLQTQEEELSTAEEELNTAITTCQTAVKDRKEEITQAEKLGRATIQYLSMADNYSTKLNEIAPNLRGPAHLLRQAIDASAGTTEMSVLIEMIDKKSIIERRIQAREILESVKDLKKIIDQTVGEVMEAAFGSDLTGSVMSWYSKIRTTGDPDVHFSGFSMDRTKSGDFKSRRVKVAAKSYGVELASAVSSLSESKLNALGLCMSIATTLRAPGPWEFLILDDPIQSWDQEHEFQFISVIRALVEEENRQVVLLSHRDDWINQVAEGCRTVNGIRYRITSYRQDGPYITEVDWAALDQRLKEVISILNDPHASIVRLQQAEEEIRIATCQLAAQIAKKKLSRDKSPHSLNQKDVRSILNSAGCTPALIDRITATFATTDDAHHAPNEYQPNVERIRQYHGAVLDLKRWYDT